ncbi:MAG: hypothetical protein CL610_25470 [Anaerolineaceae bacterium]|nr:hypothetical protein [Anaerolineaceae bacterium]
MTDMVKTPEAELLDDAGVQAFIVNGYMLVETDFPASFHESICEQIDAVMARRGNPNDDILDEVPDLQKVYDHPKVRGALMSLLGEDFKMNSHRHCHYSGSGARGGHWHQDSLNVRHHQIWRVLAMYYPQDVTEDMGPTVVLPGTQYHNTPTALMSTYMNFKDQVALSVKAGTVAITHYDIWHAWMHNTSGKHRRMLKFLFDRTTEPTQPSWDTTPDSSMYLGVGSTWLAIDDQTAAYKHRVMWRNAWRWLRGEPVEER